ncbi:gastrula zinc finger protein XlCGF57.1 [Drosophila subobscura]|uniref:gastrula zinc finger protein XlCGF57.1 n=1 Tax=Drosophila subobscura TaxID=7241 RepID=UPI00155ADC27|nr:gastrula zinc finger protein XlCGF57.1 [Drosophila subobscura]
MLKSLQAGTYAGMANAKCGEIYFQSLNSFRIDCAFCEMKSFVFNDFLLHVQNVHFENGLLKTEELVEPKEEIDESEGSPDASMEDVNPFAWHEIASENDEDDQHTDSEDDYDMDEENDDPGRIILQWDNSNAIAKDSSTRQLRAIKVDYKEESDEEGESITIDLDLDQDQDQDLDLEDDLEPDHLDDSTTKPLSCPHCPKTYQGPKTLERHIARQHKPVDPEVEADYGMCRVLDSKPQPVYKCEQCEHTFFTKMNLVMHMKEYHKIRRQAAISAASASFTCVECDMELPRLRLLDEHMLKVHGGPACVVCKRRYKTRHELRRHQLRHNSERNVECSHPGCGKRFFTNRHMRNHTKVHTQEKNFVCENCGYSCRNKETLRVHIRSHTGERPFGCTVCDKRFPSHSGLREHMAMHSTDRPFVCNVCDATFSRQKGLYHHKFLHTDTKQFVCKLCGNAYAQAAGLAGHMRKHRSEGQNGAS